MKFFNPLITHQLTLSPAIKIIISSKSDKVLVCDEHEIYKLKSHLGKRTLRRENQMLM